jgi:hypothetical protein
MARVYTIATAALALNISTKWLDNILSHNKILGVRQNRQGVARRFSIEGLLILAIVVLLIQDLGMSAPRAIALAEQIAKQGGRYDSLRGISVHLDLPAFQVKLLEKLESAVEIAPLPQRGRPPANKTGRLE